MIDLVDYTVSYTLVNGAVPGVVESWNGIVDCGGVSIWELPVTSFIAWTQHMQQGYHVRSGYLTFVNAPWILQNAGRIILPLFDPFLSEKTRFLGTDFKPFLHKVLGKENLEKKFGGWIPDKKADFFPPRYNAKG